MDFVDMADERIVGWQLEIHGDEPMHAFRGKIAKSSSTGVPGQYHVRFEWLATLKARNGILWSHVDETVDAYMECFAQAILPYPATSDMCDVRGVVTLVIYDGPLTDLLPASPRHATLHVPGEHEFDPTIKCEGRVFAPRD